MSKPAASDAHNLCSGLTQAVTLPLIGSAETTHPVLVDEKQPCLYRGDRDLDFVLKCKVKIRTHILLYSTATFYTMHTRHYSILHHHYDTV